ncbi:MULTISPECIES: single-stranded DNA-binding protein [unclassified Nonomuraea]|uniref:single-stranded DNA-binding protein n=1 Tax=unclassified Nonomuraea TaxID=2593643 RepID=UPI0033DF61A3
MLVGRLSAAAEVKRLPSGDTLTRWRVAVRRDRPHPKGGVMTDSIPCVTFDAATAAVVRDLKPDDPLEVRGAFRCRIYGPSSGKIWRYEVEVFTAEPAITEPAVTEPVTAVLELPRDGERRRPSRGSRASTPSPATTGSGALKNQTTAPGTSPSGTASAPASTDALAAQGMNASQGMGLPAHPPSPPTANALPSLSDSTRSTAVARAHDPAAGQPRPATGPRTTGGSPATPDRAAATSLTPIAKPPAATDPSAATERSLAHEIPGVARSTMAARHPAATQHPVVASPQLTAESPPAGELPMAGQPMAGEAPRAGEPSRAGEASRRAVRGSAETPMVANPGMQVPSPSRPTRPRPEETTSPRPEETTSPRPKETETPEDHDLPGAPPTPSRLQTMIDTCRSAGRGVLSRTHR